MTSLQESKLLRLLSFLVRPWEYGVPVPVADVPVSSKVEVMTGRLPFSGTNRDVAHDGSDNQAEQTHA